MCAAYTRVARMLGGGSGNSVNGQRMHDASAAMAQEELAKASGAAYL